MAEQVAIVGAGVSGLTCGIVLAEAGYDVTIFAREIGQQTHSAAAAAIWFPYDAEPIEQVIKWSLASLQHFAEVARESASGVTTRELRCFGREGKIAIPRWAAELGAQYLPAAEVPAVFASGFAMDVPVIDTSMYLDYLSERLRAAGGTIVQAEIRELEEIAPERRIVINCSGIGAKELVCDAGMAPHRGQVVIVEPVALRCAVVCDDPPLMYAIPRGRDCVLGGTNEVSADARTRPAETAAIVAEFERVTGAPGPRILRERVGLRPFRRSGVRLERGELRDRRPVIHNYGHGGSGFTLSWGCAESVLALAGEKE